MTDGPDDWIWMPPREHNLGGDSAELKFDPGEDNVNALHIGPPSYTSVEQMLMDPSSASRLIHPTEIALVMDLLKDVGWELLKRWNKDDISLFQHKGFAVGGGNILMKAVLDFPRELPAGHVIQTLEDFETRHIWDNWCGRAYFANVLGENDVVHGHIDAYPYTTRDYLIYSATWRRRKGGAMVTYSRPAPDGLRPASNSVVRAKMHFNCVFVEERPDGGCRLTVTTLLDLGLPFVPVWLANWFVPTQLRSWGISFKAEIFRRLAKWNAQDSLCARYIKMLLPLRKSDTTKSLECTDVTEPVAESDKGKLPRLPDAEFHDEASKVLVKAVGTTATQFSPEVVRVEASEAPDAACCWTSAKTTKISL